MSVLLSESLDLGRLVQVWESGLWVEKRPGCMATDVQKELLLINQQRNEATAVCTFFS